MYDRAKLASANREIIGCVTHLKLDMQYRWELDGSLSDLSLLAFEFDFFWSIILREAIVDVLGGTRLADVDEDVVKDEVLVV